MAKNEEAAIWGSNLDDYSAAATVVPFDPPLPLLRGPVPAAASDDPSAGSFVLAFPSAGSWRAAHRATESKIIGQCEAGSRIGCSISASSKCKPPWWKSLFGMTPDDFAERERCEENEMSICLAASKEACIQFAKKKSLLPFQDARIALVDPKGVASLLFWGCRTSENVIEAERAELKLVDLQHEALSNLSGCNVEVTNYRGSALLGNSSTHNP